MKKSTGLALLLLGYAYAKDEEFREVIMALLSKTREPVV